MEVFVTGATGLVGAHSARALMDAGHRLRLLVREPAAADAYFRAHDYSAYELIVGDMRDQPLVEQGMAGVDAVLHAAAVVNVDPRMAELTYAGNIAGIDAVIGTACRLGIANIVHVSSLSALFNPGATLINEQSPLGEVTEAYSRSKRDGDLRVRAWQQQGFPIQISYPGAVFGPDDPRLSESNGAVIAFMKAMIPNTTSGIQCIDARDVAHAHHYLIENRFAGAAPEARFILGGHFMPWSDFHQLMQGLTPRRILHPPIHPALFRWVGRVVGMIKRKIPLQLPLSAEATAFVTQWTPADSSRILNEAQFAFRPAEQTFTDTLRWLVCEGHLEPHYLSDAQAVHPA